MPWMVAIFGILVIPLGLVHIFLVISQPVVVGHWCTFCLMAAAVMLPMIPLEVDEVIAMGQFMVQAKRKGLRLSRVFWLGGDVEGEGDDKRTPQLKNLPEQPRAVLVSSIWGMSFPWTLVASALLGGALMFTPFVFGMESRAADTDHVGGALILTMATLAMGEPIRLVRYLNVPLGAWVAIAPWFIATATFEAAGMSSILGFAAILMAFPAGRIQERYGLWQRFIR
jgi:hypothetical protein